MTFAIKRELVVAGSAFCKEKQEECAAAKGEAQHGAQAARGVGQGRASAEAGAACKGGCIKGHQGGCIRA